ncbi:MAG: hypothetical protein MUE69_23105 [Myxococcota bacterium]|nr:hypothetical protein [Myxococcota bacterium]
MSARLDSASGELGDDCHEERDGSRGHLDSLREAAAEMNRPASAAEAEDRIADFERVRAVARESIDNYVSCAMKIRSERRILVAVIAVVLTMGAVAIYWLRRRRRGSKEGIR